MEVNNLSEDEILSILEYFDFNWTLIADHFNSSVQDVQSRFLKYSTRKSKPSVVLDGFESAQIRKEQINHIQIFIQDYLAGSLPVLFSRTLSEEDRVRLSKSILVEMGLTYKLLHSKKYSDEYCSLEDEALQLARWREQSIYLTILEDALFRIAAMVSKER